MVRFRPIVIFTVLAIAVFGQFQFHQILFAGEQKPNHVSFCWAFGAIVGTEDNPQLVPISRDTVLKTGDQFKMFVELKQECFVYIFYRDPQDEICLLFPSNPDAFDYKIPGKYYIPQKHMWFQLDEHTGTETFYLLASVRRLSELEMLYAKYIASADSDKQDLGKQILLKIRELKRKHRKLTASAERPVRLGGTLRGVVKKESKKLPDIDTLAVEISAPEFYSRTFEIDHQ